MVEQAELDNAQAQSQGIEEWYQDCAKVFDEWLKLEKFSYSEKTSLATHSYLGGKITCKCGKSYQWRDWGYMAHGASRMVRHLRREHGVSRGEKFYVTWPFLKRWVDKKEKVDV